MIASTRREFLERTLLVAGLGCVGAPRLLALVSNEVSDDPLDFGQLQPLVDVLAATPPEQLQAVVVARLRAGLIR